MPEMGTQSAQVTGVNVNPRILNETDFLRLVRLCATLSGSPQAAEDLAQETMLEAWRCIARLEDEDGYWRWLTAIARNICMRWGRRQARQRAGEAKVKLPGDRDQGWPHLEVASNPLDIEVELERSELAVLLDRGMALLPPGTRAVLIERYIEDFPQSEIAARLHLSEGAVEARLHRGKLSLRKLFTTDLREEAESLGILLPQDSHWHDTRIWCPFCGKHKTLCRIDQAVGQFHFRCGGECMPGGTVVAANGYPSGPAGNLKSPKVVLTHILLQLHDHYERAIRAGGQKCHCCGRAVRLELCAGEEWPYPPGIRMVCAACGCSDDACLCHLALDTPAAQRFWKAHPRIRLLPTTELEHEGRPALLTGFQSLDGAARLAVLFDAETYCVLHTHTPGDLRAGGNSWDNSC